jgi:hypothetical protein
LLSEWHERCSRPSPLPVCLIGWWPTSCPDYDVLIINPGVLLPLDRAGDRGSTRDTLCCIAAMAITSLFDVAPADHCFAVALIAAFYAVGRRNLLLRVQLALLGMAARVAAHDVGIIIEGVDRHRVQKVLPV